MKMSQLHCHKRLCTHQVYGETQQCIHVLTNPLGDFFIFATDARSY